MGRIHVVSDSGSDLPKEIREKYNISIVPLSIQFGDDVYVDGVDMPTERFYSELKNGDRLPSTCQPSPADFVKLYEEIAEPGDEIISVHLSSKLSGTYQSAVLASTMVSDISVTVVDSKLASIGIGFVALAAAEAVQNGASKEEALAQAQKVIDNLGVYFVVDTLDFLRRNGRIGKAQAVAGTLLNIKPILTLDDGVVAPVEKVRGKAKALKKIRESIRQYQEDHGGKKLRIGLTHADCLEEAQRFAELLKQDIDIHDLYIDYIGPTIGVHVGPGTMALLFHPIE